MHWSMCGSNMKSVEEINKLITDVLLNEDFTLDDIADFNAAREAKQLDNWDGGGMNLTTDGWKESTVKISLPCEGNCCPEEDAPELEIPGVFHRDLIDVITSTYQSPSSSHFHITPFTQMWRPTNDSSPIRIYGEAYTSDVLLEAQIEVKTLYATNRAKLEASPEFIAPLEPKLEVVVCPLMLYTDGTCLASYGTASAWPGYLYIASLSKYVRGRPTSNSANHLVYMPSVNLFDSFLTSLLT